MHERRRMYSQNTSPAVKRLTTADKQPMNAGDLARRLLIGRNACGWYMGMTCMCCSQCLSWASVVSLASPVAEWILG